jgi:hypothetical protein
MDKNYLLFAVKVFLRQMLYTFICIILFGALVVLFFMLMRYSTEQISAFKTEGYPYQSVVNMVFGIIVAFTVSYFSFKRTYLNDSKKFKIELLLGIKYCILFSFVVGLIFSIGRPNLGINNIYDAGLFIFDYALMGFSFYLAGTRAENKHKS